MPYLVRGCQWAVAILLHNLPPRDHFRLTRSQKATKQVQTQQKTKKKCHSPSAMSVLRLQMNNRGPGPNLMKRTLRATRKRKPTRLEVFSLGLGVWMGCTTEVLRPGSVISDPGSCVTGFGFGGVGGAWWITADHFGLRSASFTGGLPLRG